MGYCPDLTPVGVAARGVLVGSRDSAHDLLELKRLGVTHILNVACIWDS